MNEKTFAALFAGITVAGIVIALYVWLNNTDSDFEQLMWAANLAIWPAFAFLAVRTYLD